MFSTGEDIQHYTKLYSCKYFRNRVLRLQKLCGERNLDAVVLVVGDDVHRDPEMAKLSNWLMFGLSTNDICGGLHDSDLYADSFFVISKDGFQAYTSVQGFKVLSNLTTLLQNCNLYTLTKADENDSERSEVLKMSRFLEMVHDKKAVGMPCRKLRPAADFVTSEMQLVEKWPIIQAYGLDMVGGGFFTMKHGFCNLRDELDVVYKEYDAFSKYRTVNEEIERLNNHYYDNFFSFNRDTPQKRQQRTEHELVEAFWLRYEFSLVQKRKSEFADSPQDDGLPVPRVLIGQNSNKAYNELSDQETRLYKFHAEDSTDPALHFTMEYVEKNTNLRFARTYFLSNLSQNYMRNMYFSQDDDHRVTSAKGKINELNTQTLFDVYNALVETYQECSDMFLKGTTTLSELKASQAYQTFKKLIQPKVKDFDSLLKDGKDSFMVDVHQSDTYGQCRTNSERCSSDRMIMIRMQVRDVMSAAEDGVNLGSVLFAQSFIMIEDSSVYINVTKNVPNLQSWFSSVNHFESLPLEVNTLKNLECEHLGERLRAQSGGVLYSDLHGLLPIKEEFSDQFEDIVLNGKLVFYEKGMIFVDNRLHAIALPYDLVSEMNVHVTNEWWLEITTQDSEDSQLKIADLFPQNMIAQQKLFLKVDKKFFDDKFKLLEKQLMINRDEHLSKMKKLYTECPLVSDSLAMRNFFVNQKYNKQYSTDFLNLSFQIKQYREYMEFNALSEFNRLRGKEFIAFTGFSKVYTEADQQASMPDSKTDDLVKKLLDGTDQKTSVVIVSGIPGSGKGRLADQLSRYIKMENVAATSFKMGTVQDSVKYSSEKFIKAMTLFKQTNEDARNAKVIVATLSSYNHLKKAIFELKKSEAFGKWFDIKFVVTKVSARNFYMNKNRNCFQYLIENCMKGVSNAVIFERQGVPQSEIDIMYRTLRNANFPRNIILTPGKTFALDELAKVICYQNERFSVLYNKYFYGFEKEGKSNYYLDNAVTGAYFNFRYPFNEVMVGKCLTKAINMPLSEGQLDREVRERTAKTVAKEEEEKRKEAARVEEMDERERRRYDREQKRKRQLEDDLAPEVMLRDEIEVVRRKVGLAGYKDAFIERVRGFVTLEGEKGDQDYQLVCHFNNLEIKGMKNQANRLEPCELGVMLYGRNLTAADGSINPQVKDALRTARTHLAEKQDLRTRDSVTEDEIKELETKFLGLDLPTDKDWLWTGFCYQDSHSSDRCWEHPNREFLIERYLKEINSDLASFNNGVEQTWEADAEKYE